MEVFIIVFMVVLFIIRELKILNLKQEIERTYLICSGGNSANLRLVKDNDRLVKKIKKLKKFIK